MKNIIKIIIVCMCTTQAFSQYDEFLISFYSYDFDNRGNSYYTEVGTDPLVGNDIDYLRLVKDMNITTVDIAGQLFWFYKKYARDNPSKLFLDNARDLDLDIILHCPDIDVDRNNPSYDPMRSIEALNYYGNEPAMVGFSITDEPNTDQFSFIDLYADDIETFDPSLLRSANLLPNVATRDQLFQNGNHTQPTYEEYAGYVQDYIDIVEPNFFSFDAYPITSTSVPYQNRFFSNLDIFAKKSVLNNLPYVYVLISIKEYPDPFDCDELPITKNTAEFYYVIFASLFYNAKGISYWHNGCLNDFFDNISQDVQNNLKDLHMDFLEHSSVLLDLEFQSAYHKSFNSTIFPGVVEIIHNDSQWSNFVNDPIANQIFSINNPISPLKGSTDANLAISFLTDSFGNNYFWVFNKSIDNESNIRLNFNHELSLVDILEDKMYSECLYRYVSLEKGEAKLFKVNDNFYNSVSLCNGSFPFGIYPDVWSKTTNIGGLSCNVNYNNGARINYYSEKISINGGVSAHEGSDVSFKGVELEACSDSIKDEKNTSSNEELFENSGDFTIYPNPNSGSFSIALVGNIDSLNSVQIFDILGHKIVDLQNVVDLNFELSYKLSKGTYIIKLILSDGSSVVDKFIVM